MNVSNPVRTAVRSSKRSRISISRHTQVVSKYLCSTLQGHNITFFSSPRRSHHVIATGKHRPRPLYNSRLVSPRRSTRHISTDTRTWIVDSFKGAVRVTAYLWAGVFLTFVAYQGWEHDKQEQSTPTPPEWSMITRYWLREAKRARYPSQLQGVEPPHWIDVGRNVLKAIERLEDPNGDGKDVRPALGEGEGDIFVEGVGRAGLDISACPEPWRRGYFDALMTAGTAAEHLEGFVVDKSKKKGNNIFPPQVVIGPSNPTPMPMPLNSKIEAPREENCDLFFDPPHKYYMKVLTTVGFTSDQKLAAALSYADWLDFKGLPDSASDMYDWAMDIADAAYVARGEQAPYDRKSGTLRPGKHEVSDNVLKAINATAEHLAKSGDIATALPAFLTTLRILRGLPASSPDAPSETPQNAGPPPAPPESSSPLSFLTSFIVDPPLPPPPRSGDLPAIRTSSSPCAEAAVLAHIGEILYVSPASLLPRVILSSASSSPGNAIKATAPQISGLAWTKQAVDLAESSLCQLAGRDRDELLLSGSGTITKPLRAKKIPNDGDAKQNRLQREDAMKTCAQCLDVAVGNWQKMVSRLADKERELQADRARQRRGEGKGVTAQLAGTGKAGGEGGRSSGWFGWLWGSGGGDGSNQSKAKLGGSAAAGDSDIGVWIEEARVVEERKMAARRLLREERLPVNF